MSYPSFLFGPIPGTPTECDSPIEFGTSTLPLSPPRGQYSFEGPPTLELSLGGCLHPPFFCVDVLREGGIKRARKSGVTPAQAPASATSRSMGSAVPDARRTGAIALRQPVGTEIGRPAELDDHRRDHGAHHRSVRQVDSRHGGVSSRAIAIRSSLLSAWRGFGRRSPS